MKLSIIVPFFNTEMYIEECLNSILNEMTEETELILVNDGSTDNSELKCKEIIRKNISKKIVLFSNENHGVSYSRNYGLNEAKGEWIIFVDSDDKLRKDWLKEISAFFDSDAEIVAFSQNVDNKINLNASELLEIIVSYKKNNIFLSAPFSKLFKKQFLIDNQIYFKEKVINGEDMLFNIECLSKSTKYKLCDKGIYLFRENINSSTKRFDERIFDSDIKFHYYLSNMLSNNLKFTACFKDKIILFCKKNAMITIAQRLSYSGKYEVVKKYSYVFKEYYSKKMKNIRLGIKKEIIILMLRLHLNYIVYLIFNMRRKRLKQVNNYFINI